MTTTNRTQPPAASKTLTHTEMPKPNATARRQDLSRCNRAGMRGEVAWNSNTFKLAMNGATTTTDMGFSSMGAWPLKVVAEVTSTPSEPLKLAIKVMYTDGQIRRIDVQRPAIKTTPVTVKPDPKAEDLDFSANNVKLRYELLNEKFQATSCNASFNEKLQTLREAIAAFRKVDAERERLLTRYKEEGRTPPFQLSDDEWFHSKGREQVYDYLICARKRFVIPTL